MLQSSAVEVKNYPVQFTYSWALQEKEGTACKVRPNSEAGIIYVCN